MKGAAKRWRQQKLSKAWNQWRWVAAKMRELLQGFSKEELVQKLADALERIQQLEAENRELRQRLAKNEHFIAYGAINRMMKLGLSKGWEQWQHSYAEAKHQEKILKGAVRRMRNRMLSKAWEKWQFEANKLSKSEYLMQRALLRMMQLALAKGWTKWHESYLEQKRLEKVMKGAAKRWRQQKLSKAWNQWRWVAAKMRALLDGCTKEELVQKLSDALERIQALEREIQMLKRERELSDAQHAAEIDKLLAQFEADKRGLIREWQGKVNEIQVKLDAANKEIERLKAFKPPVPVAVPVSR
jgi:hypothetical protein